MVMHSTAGVMFQDAKRRCQDCTSPLGRDERAGRKTSIARSRVLILNRNFGEICQVVNHRVRSLLTKVSTKMRTRSPYQSPLSSDLYGIESYLPKLDARFANIIEAHQEQLSTGQGPPPDMPSDNSITGKFFFGARRKNLLLLGSDSTRVPDRLAGCNKPCRFLTKFAFSEYQRVYGPFPWQLPYECDDYLEAYFAPSRLLDPENHVWTSIEA